MGTGASGQGRARGRAGAAVAAWPAARAGPAGPGGGAGRPGGRRPRPRRRPRRRPGSGSSRVGAPAAGAGAGSRSGPGWARPTGCWCSSRAGAAAGTTGRARRARRSSTTAWTPATTRRGRAGVLDLDDPRNPFRGWSVLFVPSCTGDVYAGDAVRTYRAGRRPGGHRPPPRPRQRHRRPRLDVPPGAGPAPGVRGRLQRRQHRLDPARPPDPPAVPARPRWPSSATPSATCSAGRPTSGSCGGPTGCCPTGCRACGRSRGPASPCRGSTRRSPPTTHGRPFAQVNFTEDARPARASTRPPGAPGRFSQALRGNLAAIRAGSPNFRSCLLDGSAHCALPSPDFYSLESGGVSLRDWVAAQADGDPVANLPPGS